MSLPGCQALGPKEGPPRRWRAAVGRKRVLRFRDMSTPSWLECTVTTHPSPSQWVPRCGRLLCQVPAACTQVVAGVCARKAVALRPRGPTIGRH